MSSRARDHGGRIDAAIKRFGGARDGWLDLSTGINPIPYPLPDIPAADWQNLPDEGAEDALLAAARRFWRLPDGADIVASQGASALIATLPHLSSPSSVQIKTQSYNEHAAAFDAAGWQVGEHPASARVIVHPNNPDGALWDGRDMPPGLLIIDESFCDINPAQSRVDLATDPNTVILKSFGKFWGLAGLRLGFAIGDHSIIANLRDRLGPWSVSGPALRIGQQALSDPDWATATRQKLANDADRLDALLSDAGIQTLGGTSLFRLYHTQNATAFFDHLGAHHILCRTFPYDNNWIRLGLPGGNADWAQLTTALSDLK